MILGEDQNLRKGVERENRIIQTIMGQILFALDSLHSTGIVHRDIKPQNIIFSEGDSTTLNQLTMNFFYYISVYMISSTLTYSLIKTETDSRTFKIIDLGAAADLRVGINYIPKEFLLDPRYFSVTTTFSYDNEISIKLALFMTRVFLILYNNSTKNQRSTIPVLLRVKI